MNYRTTKEISIIHKTDDFGYTLNADEYGTVCITSTEGIEAMTGKTTHLFIPKDCIQNFIDALEQFK